MRASRGLCLLCFAAFACQSASSTKPTLVTTASDDAKLGEALKRIDEATNDMVNGDSTRWVGIYSHAADATLFGGWGGHEKGWDQLAPRWRMVTSRYRTGKMTVEPISKHVSGDLAVTVQFVRGTATFSDGSGGNVGLRVTHVLRREAGEWKIVHRHADEQMNLLPISSHIQPAPKP